MYEKWSKKKTIPRFKFPLEYVICFEIFVTKMVIK